MPLHDLQTHTHTHANHTTTYLCLVSTSSVTRPQTTILHPAVSNCCLYLPPSVFNTSCLYVLHQISSPRVSWSFPYFCGLMLTDCLAILLSILLSKSHFDLLSWMILAFQLISSTACFFWPYPTNACSRNYWYPNTTISWGSV